MDDFDLTSLCENEFIDAADLSFARSILRLGRCEDPLVGLSSAMVRRAAENGHVCLDLAAAHRQGLSSSRGQGGTIKLPGANQWQKRLLDCPCVGRPGEFRPLILDQGRLYLHRYWTYEQNLAAAVKGRCTDCPRDFSKSKLHSGLNRIFPDGESGQRRAVQAAATQWFTVVSGGPGTGKTYTVARIIQLLQLLYVDRPLRVHLAAPTGKAAARLQEAIENAMSDNINTADGRTRQHPEAQTLHRMLGYRPVDAFFAYRSGHLLNTDLVIVDEASMVDLAMMCHLMDAVPPDARLILVGDKDQLASVEAGAVLGDICFAMGAPGTGEPCDKASKKTVDHPISDALSDHIVVLDKSYRFDEQSGIDLLAGAINNGDSQHVLSLLSDARYPALKLETASSWRQTAEKLGGEMALLLKPLFEASSPSAALEHLSDVKLLTALRKGPFGIDVMNETVEEALAGAGLIPRRLQASAWYPGRPVMVLRNDYFRGLFNGDIGVTMEKRTQGGMAVIFPDSTHGCRQLDAQQLTEHQTSYAMTVHKSQGSEFNHINLLLPDTESPLLTRELIYTAVTRARKSITIWAVPELLCLAVERPIQRTTGLRQALG